MKGGEVIQLGGLVSCVLSKVIDVIEKDRRLRRDVKGGLEYIWREMRMVTLQIEFGEKNQGAAHETKIMLLRELAFDIEDFIDGTWWVPGARGLIFSAIGMDPRHQTLQEINNFKDSVQRVRDWEPDAGDGGSRQDEGGGAKWLSSSPAPCNLEAKVTEFQETSAEHICRRLLLPAAKGQPPELRVISIVGRRGVGKTALARAVYDRSRHSSEYEFVNWVVASECSNRDDLLRKLLNKDSCLPQASSTAEDGSISHVEQMSLQRLLQNKRYLVVIDDIDRAEVWKGIKDEFPDNRKTSRIIVTTNVHSVAAECSWGCYVYTLHGLGKTESEGIFWEIVGHENRSPALECALDGILKKCGNLPLALVCAANYLHRKGRDCRASGGLTTMECKLATRAFGDMIQKGQVAEFARISRALLQCYNGLPDYMHRNCLLYASVFPRGCSINRKVLIRRWIAEGLVVGSDILTEEEVANRCLEEFIDKNIIETVLIRNARVSKFRVYSTMLEFIIHKAVSQNLAALVDKGSVLCYKETARAQCQGNKGPIFGVRVRRLSVQGSEKEAVDKAAKDINLSAMRSLTIYRSHLIDMQACKLLRVLDLGGCKGVEKIVRGDICNLQFLKYLNLRCTDVLNLPSEMGRLEHLETLDVRDTGVNVVPIEVISLPMLAHLLGRFSLPDGITSKILKGSKLQTLAGVVIDKVDRSFEKTILHATELREVRIYQTTSDSSSSSPNKKPKRSYPPRDYGRASTSNSSLLQLKNRFTGGKPLQILSIHSSELSKEFLSFLEGPCCITCIKLRGKLETLPANVTLSQLVGLNKLLLISTGLSSEDLSALQSLYFLEYLKLAEDSDRFWAGSFVVHSGGFPSLKRLCFKAEKLPQVKFREGSMKSLTILDILCPCRDIQEHELCSYLPCQTRDHNACKYCLGMEGISNLTYLNEVILHHATDDTIMRAWNDVAIWHKNKPSVKKQQR